MQIWCTFFRCGFGGGQICGLCHSCDLTPPRLRLSSSNLLSVGYVIASESMATNPIRSIWGSNQISLIHCNPGVKCTSGQYEAAELWQNYKNLIKNVLVRLKQTCLSYTWGEVTTHRTFNQPFNQRSFLICYHRLINTRRLMSPDTGKETR